MSRTVTAIALASAGVVLAIAGPSAAKGCNGYVNQMQWGCAPWDNNNGPQYPHYTPPAPARTATPALATRASTPIMAATAKGVSTSVGASAVSHDGGSLIGQDGNGFKPR